MMDLKGLTNYGGPPPINDAGTESKEVRPYISNGNEDEDIQGSDRKYPINIPNLTFTAATTKAIALTTSLLHEVSSNEDITNKILVIGDNTILLEVENSNSWSQDMSQRQQQSQQQPEQRQQQNDENVSDFLRGDDDNEGKVEEHSCVIHSNNSPCFCSYPSTSYTYTNGGSTRTSTMVPNAVCLCENEKCCLCLPKSVAHNCVPVEDTDNAMMESTGNALLKGSSNEINMGSVTTNPARQNGYQRRKSHFSTNANVNSNSNAKSSLFSPQNTLPQLKSPQTTTASSSTTPLEVATANPTTTFSCRPVRFPPSMSSIASSSSTSSAWSMLRWIIVVLLLGVSVVSGRAYTFHDGKYYLTPFNAAQGIVFKYNHELIILVFLRCKII